MKLQSFVFLCLVLMLISCQRENEMAYPEKEWQSSDPADQQVDPELLNKALKMLERYCGVDGLDEVVIVRNGRVIYQGDSANLVHNIYSCTKSLTSTVLGLMIQDKICTLDTRVSTIDMLLSKEYPAATLRHFTTMTSGYSAEGSSRWCEGCSEDWSWTPYAPASPLFVPGTAYAYWDEAQMYLGKLLTMRLGTDLRSFLDKRIMKPIGVRYWDWHDEGSWNGIPIRNGCTGISISALDLARIGHLFLNNGSWNGQQIIDSNWVKQATGVQVSDDLPVANTDRSDVLGNGRYGFNWWVRGDMGDMPDTPPGTYYMSGFNNNMCFVIPEWNLVFVRRGEDGNPPEGKRFVYNLFFKELSGAIWQDKAG